MDLSRVKNLLVIRLSSLGDVLLATPVIRSVKKAYPDIKLDFIVREEYSDVLRYNPNVDNIISYTSEKADTAAFKERLQNGGYDLAVDLQNNIRSRRLTKKLGIPVVRFGKKSVEKFLLVNFKINKLKSSGSIPERYAGAIENLKLDDEGLDLFLPEDLNREGKKDSNRIGFAPGSKHFTKMWPEEYYIELGRLLSAKGYKVVILGGSIDKEICRKITEALPGSINLSGENSLFDTAAAMKNCSAVVCNDSGLMHASCALKIPVLAFFGSTVKEFGFAPYKNNNIVLENNSLSCRPCSHIGKDKCPKGHFKCMTELTPGIAFEKLKMLISAS